MNDGQFNGGSALGAAPTDLVTSADVQAALPDLTAAQIADLPAVITAVSNHFEGRCRRKLALQDFDKCYRPGRRRKFYLDTWPVASCRLKTDLVVPLTIVNNDTSGNQVATVRLTPTQLILERISSGVTADPVNLTLEAYPTVTELATAINALGFGWRASLDAGLERTAVSELNPDRETAGALLQQVELRIFQRYLSRYVLDAERGIVELTENRPDAFRYADRAYGIGFGWSWSAAAEPRHADVRAIYRAGYAVTEWDLTAGYEPVPPAIKRAALMSIKATLDLTPAANVVRETIGAYSYALGDGPQVITPPAVAGLLAPFVSKRL